MVKILLAIRHVRKWFPLLLCIPCFSFGQNDYRQQASAVIHDLCSRSMHGRGYVKSGDRKAARYIRKHFKRIGLKSYGKSFFQPFSISVNTFPGAMKVTIDGKVLAPGVDYIVDASSGGGHGSYFLKMADTTRMTDSSGRISIQREDLGKTILVADGNFFHGSKKHLRSWLETESGAAGIMYLENKPLVASVSNGMRKIPVLHVSKKAMPADAEKIGIRIKNTFIPHHLTQNVIGYVPGTTRPDSLLVFTAHYDHLGRMGKNIFFPGANDNASGTSMLLLLAEHYKKHPSPYTMAFIAFAAEEAGLAGSWHFTKHPFFPLDKIHFLINMDLLGTGDEGLMAVNGSLFGDTFRILEEINEKNGYVPAIKKRGKSANSDHHHFTENGVPCFFLYTLGGIAAYHDISDRPETLPLTRYNEVFRLITDFSDILIGRKKR